jgi:hypothetical protein
MKRSGLSRRTGLRRSTPLRRTALRRKASREQLPVESRTSVRTRSRGLCEPRILYGGVCLGKATHVHHRRLLGVGGAHGAARREADRLSSLLHCCAACHRWIHADPERAMVNGWIIPRHADPTAEALWIRGQLKYLTDEGRAVDYEAACA